MRPENDDVPQTPKPVPCASCTKPSEAAVWGTPLCIPCVNAWDAEAPTQEAAEQKYPDDTERYRAFQDFTVKWAAARRVKARAAA